MDKRVNWIDWAKTLGIFLVVLGHIYYAEDILYPKSLIYGFHMSFFFLISGFLHKQESDFFKKNLQRLLIPYFFYNALVLVFFCIPYCLLGDMNPIKLLILGKRSLLGLQFPLSVPSWFLFALFWAKVVNHFILKVKPLFAILLSVLVATLGYVIYHNVSHQIPFFLCQGMLSTPFITFGYFMKKYNVIDLFFKKKALVVLFGLIFLPIYLILVSKLGMFDIVICNLTNSPFLGVIMTAIGCCLFILFCRSLNKYSNRFIQQISSGTIVILGLNLDLYWAFINLLSIETTIPMSLLVCCLIMITCYLIISLVQKNSILSALFLGKISRRI